MANKQLNAVIQLRKDTESNWNSSNPILANGELAVVLTSTGIRFKVGDGTSQYSTLDFQDEAVYNQITYVSGQLSTLNGTVESLNTEVGSISGTVDSMNSTLSGQQITISGLQLSLNSKAEINSPTFTGSPASTTPSAGDNSTRIATTAFVQEAISGFGGGTTVYVQSGQPSGAKTGDLWYKIL